MIKEKKLEEIVYGLIHRGFNFFGSEIRFIEESDNVVFFNRTTRETVLYCMNPYNGACYITEIIPFEDLQKEGFEDGFLDEENIEKKLYDFVEEKDYEVYCDYWNFFPGYPFFYVSEYEGEVYNKYFKKNNILPESQWGQFMGEY